MTDRRTDDEIRADIASKLRSVEACDRLVADAEPLLDRALTAEAEVAALRAENDQQRNSLTIYKAEARAELAAAAASPSPSPSDDDTSSSPPVAGQGQPEWPSSWD